ncbi:phenylacetate--CoA ligase family protein [Pseudoalteromonas sp. S4741]|uniref:phenylacetate--CoA ligase family protein n=1 Tax=Pseudoalteromonas sp. S4741 TaxID=579563 RepID=UPI00110A63D5|nr:phenylacetate--CoA ligase family protein [Pseudoalteromonas sp. S4741]
MLNKIIYKLGSLKRNPSMNTCYKELKNTEFASRKELDKLQNKRLQELMVFCYQNSPYYRKVFTSNNINPTLNEFKVNDLALLPLLSKRTLIEENKEIHSINSFKFKKLFFSETSGSTGEALTFYKDEVWDSYNRASINRGLSWFNVSPWERSGYFWGFNFSSFQQFKIKLFDVLVNRFRIFSYSDKELATFLKKCRNAKYLEGYSSMIYEVAKLANKNGTKVENLALIKGTSEKIYSYYHKETIKAFGCKIVSEYGAAESGIIAFECPEGRMHLNEETSVVEVIDGRAIVTNLVARSFPTIRYELGDFIKLSQEKCPCGREHKVLEEVTGRVGANILGQNNTFYPSLTLYYVFKNLALQHGVELAYRCEQKVLGQLDVYIEHEITVSLKELLEQEFLKYFNGNIICNYYSTQSVRVKGKKLKDFISYI